MFELAAALGVGGIVGAVGALFIQASSLPDSLERLLQAVETCLAGRSDESVQNVRRRIDEFRSDFGLTMKAIDSVRRVLRIRL